jgi:hypothetical protein
VIAPIVVLNVLAVVVIARLGRRLSGTEYGDQTLASDPTPSTQAAEPLPTREPVAGRFERGQRLGESTPAGVELEESAYRG